MGNLHGKPKTKSLTLKPLLSCVFPSDTGAASNEKIVVALFTFTARERGELSFCKGDRLRILDDRDSDWWRVCHLTHLTKGLIPSNYVAQEKTLRSQEWFYGGVSCKYAEETLMTAPNQKGAFLIRKCVQTAGVYFLSICDWECKKGYHVKHYRIKTTDNGNFYFTVKKTFETLQELVAYYSGGANGLCHKLTIPCSKFRPDISDLSCNTRNESQSSLQLIRKLGSGHFEDIWYGKWKGSTEVAVKILKSGTEAPCTFLREVEILKKFHHEKLVSIYAVSSKEEPFLIVTEYMVNGSLLDYLRTQEGRNLRLHSLIDMAAQIASGMAYLANEEFVHGDLAARNILVGANNVVKIAGFNRIIGVRFAVKWTAPEAAFYGRFSIKSDVWSYGIVLYELISYGEVPYPGMHNGEIMEQVSSQTTSFFLHTLAVNTLIEQVDGGYPMPKPTNCECPDSVYSMMLQCWCDEPKKRPTFKFLFDFFNDYFVATDPSYHNAMNV